MNESRKSEDFLLVEYRNLADSFWRNEEAGERRVNFFITLVTAVISALVAWATRGSGVRTDFDYAIVLFALLALLALGIVTFLRMLRRNQVTDSYKRAMDMIRAFFKEGDERLRDYEPFKRTGRKIGRGGLAEMVAVLNSVIGGAIGVALGMIVVLPWWSVGLLGLVFFVFALVLQFNVIVHAHVQSQVESEK